MFESTILARKKTSIASITETSDLYVTKIIDFQITTSIIMTVKHIVDINAEDLQKF